MRTLPRFRGADRVVDAVLLSGVRRALLGPEAFADLDGVDHLLDARAGVRKLVPVGLVLVLLPARPDPELDATARHLVDARDRLREERRVAVLRRGHEASQPDRLRLARQRGEQRPCLEAVAVREALAAEEVIADPE